MGCSGCQERRRAALAKQGSRSFVIREPDGTESTYDDLPKAQADFKDKPKGSRLLVR